MRASTETRPCAALSPMGSQGRRGRGGECDRPELCVRLRFGRRARRRVSVVFFAVRLERGGPWDWSQDLREQDGWDEHARFMDSLVEDGFVLLGGPLDGEREILHAISAPSEETVRERLSQDNWHQNGMLTIKSVERWTILLDGRQA